MLQHTRPRHCDSHYPYSCDGEGRQADRQDNPGSHWAGSEQPLSQAWGERAALGWSGNTTGGIRLGVGGGVGALTHRVTHGGKGGMRGQKGEWHSSSAPQVPANSSNPKEGERRIMLLYR